MISVGLDRPDALRLIGLAGGKRHPRGGYTIDGAHYWQLNEALLVALKNISDSNGISLD